MAKIVPQPGGAPAVQTSYAYDLAGRATQISDTSGHVISYTYDIAKRLAGVSQAGARHSLGAHGVLSIRRGRQPQLASGDGRLFRSDQFSENDLVEVVGGKKCPQSRIWS